MQGRLKQGRLPRKSLHINNRRFFQEKLQWEINLVMGSIKSFAKKTRVKKSTLRNNNKRVIQRRLQWKFNFAQK